MLKITTRDPEGVQLRGITLLCLALLQTLVVGCTVLKGQGATGTDPRKEALAPQRAAAPAQVPTELAGAADLPPMNYLRHQLPVTLSAEQQRHLHEFESKPAHKAIAFSPDGQTGWAAGYGDILSAKRAALQWCLDHTIEVCYLYQADDEIVIDEFTRFIQESRAALEILRAPSLAGYAQEAQDWGVPTQQNLRTAAQGEETPTPLLAPGATTVVTREAAALLRERGVVPIYAAGWNDDKLALLPGSLVIDWIAWDAQDAKGFGDVTNAKLENRLSETMAQLLPIRTTPLLIYCDGPKCWDSYNAVLRLGKLGYTQMYWYRGGLPAWKAASLPLVKGVFHTTILTAVKERVAYVKPEDRPRPIVPGPGLWSVAVGSVRKAQAIRYCSDGVTESNVFGVDREELREALSCRAGPTRVDHGITTYAGSCNVDGVIWTIETKLRGDLARSFEIEFAVRNSAGAAVPPLLNHQRITARRIGPCLPGQPLNSFLMPDGSYLPNAQ